MSHGPTGCWPLVGLPNRLDAHTPSFASDDLFKPKVGQWSLKCGSLLGSALVWGNIMYYIYIYSLSQLLTVRKSIHHFCIFWWGPDMYFWTLVDWVAVPKVYMFTNIRTLTHWKYVYIYIYILSPYTIATFLGYTNQTSKGWTLKKWFHFRARNI